MDSEKRIGLVLSGGGAKGAFEIGVWRYLKEKGYQIDGISGSSVGALNALLVAQGDVDKAIEVWETVEQGDFTRPRGSIDEGTYLGFLDLALPAIELYMMKYSRDFPALFNRNGIRDIIEKSIYDWNAVQAYDDLYVCVAKAPKYLLDNPLMLFAERKQEAIYVNLNGLSKNEMIDYALASSAIPIAFGSVKIDGESYVDGGWADNIPVAPLINAGFKKIVVIHLKEEGSDEFFSKSASLEGFDLSGVEIIDIYPSLRLGLSDTLRIDNARIKELLEAGYNDAKRVLERGINKMDDPKKIESKDKAEIFNYENFDYDKAYNEMISQLKRPNIFICGRTGAGKSSLVNDIFALTEEEMAPVGDSKPRTKGVHEYTSERINLIDTEGYEVANDKFMEEIVGEIDRRVKDNPVDFEHHIHGAWYCVNAGEKRFLDNDRNIINEIKKREVPVMIVITKVDTVDEDELSAIKSEIKSRCPDVPCYTYSVKADEIGWDEEIKKQYVQKTEMVDWAINHLPDNLKSTFLSAVKGEITLKRKYCMKNIVLPHIAMATAAIAGTSVIGVPFSDSVPLMSIQIKMTMNILTEYGIKTDFATIMRDIAGSSVISYMGRTMASQIIGVIPFAGQFAKSVVNVSVATSVTALLGSSVAYLCEGYLKSCVDNNGQASMDFLSYFTKDKLQQSMEYVKANGKEFYLETILKENKENK